MISVNDKLSDEDGIGIGRKGTIDKPQFLKAPFWTVDTLFYLTSLPNHHTLFLYYLVQNIQWKRFDESTGVPSLSKQTIESIVKFIPNIVEQQSLSLLMKKIDNTINLHQRKLSILLNLKRNLIMYLFPRKENLFPELRFSGHSTSWEQRKLGELIEGFNHIVTGDSGLPIATSSRTGLFLQSEYFDGRRSGIDKRLDFHRVPKGYITYRHMSDDSIFKFNQNKFDTDVLVSKEYPVFKSNKISNQSFILSHLNHSPEFLRFSTMQKLGGTRVRLYFKNLKLYQLKLPSLDEQTKIGLFIDQLNKIMELHQQKINKIVKLKGIYLHKMFL